MFNNYTLVPSDLHHFVLHGYDKLTVADGKEAYRCRLEFVEPHVTFMYGLAKNKQLVYDWSNTPYMQKADEEDCKYHVKYDDIMAELLENRTKYASLIVKERKSETIDISRLKKLKGKDILELIESKRRHRK